jgi:arylsulfatase A-like enzyme
MHSQPAKRIGVRLLLCASLSCLAGVSCRSADETPASNVVLITIDTLRADHLGAYGFAHDTSPNIDALAERGVLFERAIASAGRTVPAHASIMTSRHTREHSVGHLNGRSTLRGRMTLAEHFRDAGYETAAFIGNILLTHTTGMGQGFDVFDDQVETPEANRPHVVERLAPETTERAIRWLEQPRDRPFFLWIHYQDPHGPYTPPLEHMDRFQIEGPKDEPSLPTRAGTRHKGSIPAYQVLPGLDRASQYEGRYAGEIFFADHWIGKLLGSIEASRGDRGVIIALTADHGESLGENGSYFVHTRSSTPDVAHIPLVLAAEDLEPGRRTDIVSHVDVLPTLLELAGLPIPADARGLPLGPVARGEADLPDRFVYCDNGSQLSAYREGGFIQVSGLGGAWKDPAPKPTALNPRWRPFRWQPGERWHPLEIKGELPTEISDYASDAEPMEILPPPDPELVKQLRALGYAED